MWRRMWSWGRGSELRGPKAAAQESQTGFNSFDIPGGKADRWGKQSLRSMDDIPTFWEVVSLSWVSTTALLAIRSISRSPPIRSGSTLSRIRPPGDVATCHKVTPS
jgi:hypothetical protein